MAPEWVHSEWEGVDGAEVSAESRAIKKQPRTFELNAFIPCQQQIRHEQLLH